MCAMHAFLLMVYTVCALASFNGIVVVFLAETGEVEGEIKGSHGSTDEYVEG